MCNEEILQNNQISFDCLFMSEYIQIAFMTFVIAQTNTLNPYNIFIKINTKDCIYC